MFDARFCTSDADTGGTAGASVVVEKLAGDSGSRRSTLIVLQLMLAMTTKVHNYLEANDCRRLEVN